MSSLENPKSELEILEAQLAEVRRIKAERTLKKTAGVDSATGGVQVNYQIKRQGS